MTKTIELHNLSHSFDPKGMWALKNVNLSLNAQCTSVLLGPSGIGKTTLLKIMAGVLQPDKGEVLYQGKPLSEQKHRFAYIPQEWNVSTEQCVYDYLDERCKSVLSLSEGERHQHIRSFIELFHLQASSQKSLNVLSTGQKARVVLASHLLHRPEIVMMDEPFAHLDRQLRRQLEEELKEILDSWQAGLLLVTHNLEEAFENSDEALVMIEGKLYQGQLTEFYHRPPSAEVARFLGDVNLLASKVVRCSSEGIVLKNTLGEFELKEFGAELLVHKSAHAHLMIRPEAIKILENPAKEQGFYTDEAIVQQVIQRGPVKLIWLLSSKKVLLKSIQLNHLNCARVGQNVSYLIDFKEIYAIRI